MRPNVWARHYQSVWHERSGDRRLPHWLRVAALAYGAHAANGHAMFKPGQIALVLGAVDPRTAEVLPLDKGSVQRAIRAAIDYGWLAESSGSRCLVVPGHAINGGMGGRHDAPCPQHGRQKVGTQRPPSRPKVGTECLPGGRSVPTDKPVTCTNVTLLYESVLGVSAPESTAPPSHSRNAVSA